MVRTHRDQILFTLGFTALFFFNDRFHHLVHVDIAIKMRRLMEGFRVIFTQRGAQMGEVNAWAKLFDHVDQVVVRPHAIGTGTHGETVRHAVDRIDHPLHIFHGGNNARQAEDRARRIVRVYRHTYACFFRHRNNRLQEDGKILAQRGFIDIFITSQMLAELVKRVALFRARQPGDDITGQTRFVFIAPGGETFIRLRDLFGGVVLFRTRAFEDMQLKGGKFNLIETQRFGAVRQDVFQVGAGPVENRHKVVAHGTNAALGQVTQALLVVGDPLLIVAGTGFNVFVDRHAFNDRPDQARLLNNRFAFEDLINRPHFPVRDMV